MPSNYRKGYSYENFVEVVYNAIIEVEQRGGNCAPIKLERRKKIISKSGTEAEIDIFWEFDQAGITHSVAIECKNESRNVKIGSVRDFARKISNISGLKGLMVSPEGFSKNAIIEAQSDQIDLLIVREQKDADWEGRLREVHLNINSIIPPTFKAMRPFLNKEWSTLNGFLPGSSIDFSAMNDEIFFVDAEKGFKESIHSLQQKFFFNRVKCGAHTWHQDFQDGWLVIAKENKEEEKYRIDRIEIDYFLSKPFSTKSIIDFTAQGLAVMEYVSGKTGKYLIFKSGNKKEI